MTAKMDAVLDPLKNYDISIDSDGDILTEDFFDTAIFYSLLGERRASPSEVVDSNLRRGWIGNEGKDFENGSKLWLFSQARRTVTNLNRIEDEVRNALKWLVDDGLAVAILNVSASPSNGGVSVTLEIQRTRSRVERRFFQFWNNTGLR